MLVIKDLSYSYDQHKDVLSKLNLSISTGEFVGIVGPNGCGKSTLLNLLCRVLELQYGEVIFNGTPLRGLSQQDLARLVAVVPQESIFEFDFTALEIVLMGRIPFLSRFPNSFDGNLRL